MGNLGDRSVTSSEDSDERTVPAIDLVRWIYGAWYPRRLEDPWAIGAGYGSKDLIAIEGILWSSEFFNLTRLPLPGDWLKVEVMPDVLDAPLTGRGPTTPIIEEQLTEELCGGLSYSLEQINRLQGLDYAEGLCLMTHAYLYMSLHE